MIFDSRNQFNSEEKPFKISTEVTVVTTLPVGTFDTNTLLNQTADQAELFTVNPGNKSHG